MVWHLITCAKMLPWLSMYQIVTKNFANAVLHIKQVHSGITYLTKLKNLVPWKVLNLIIVLRWIEFFLAFNLFSLFLLPGSFEHDISWFYSFPYGHIKPYASITVLILLMPIYQPNDSPSFDIFELGL